MSKTELLKISITAILFWHLLSYAAQSSIISSAMARACVIQSDGNVVVAGDAIINNIDQCVAVRYQTNGGIDTTFGTNGMTATSIGIQSQVLAMALQSDGGIVAAGFAVSNNVNQVVVIRYMTDGSLDTSFNLTGIVTTAVGNAAIATAVQIDRNDNIVVAGVTIQSGVPQFLVLRYSADGSLDPSFGINGVVTTQIGPRSKALGLAIQADGQIVVCGYSADGISDELFTLVRYNWADGSLDNSFGTNGMVTTIIGTRSHATSLAIQSDGMIVVGGFADDNIALARYTSTGTLDSTFNSTGIINSSIGSSAQINGIMLDTNSNILFTGFSDDQLLMGRFTSMGALDTSFGTGGVVMLAIGNSNAGNAIGLLSSGSSIIAGFEDNNFIVLCYTSSGLADLSWANGSAVLEPSGMSLANSPIRLWEQEAAGSNGGTFTANAWQTRVLNQIISSDTTITLAENQFTIGPGIYEIWVSGPAYRVGNHQIRLQNMTDNITALWGTSTYSNTTNGSQTSSIINGDLYINKLTTFQVQHMAQSTAANDGFGIATGFGNSEIYTVVKIVNLLN